MAVTGIGGFFFRALDPASLRAWYAEHLGITSADGGPWSQQTGPTVFEPFPAASDYFAADHQWMLNLRVDDLDALLTRLHSAGVASTADPIWNTPETGRFARIHDPEGNPIELWQPPAS